MPRVALACVFAVALAARLVYAAHVTAHVSPDSRQYLTLAANLVRHGAFSLSDLAPMVPTIRRAPGYPLFLMLTGTSARPVQCVIDALTALLICAIAASYVRLRWAVASGLLWAMHPGAVFYASSILSETLFAFLVTASIALLIAALRRNSRWPIATAGVVLALAALTRPIGATFLVPIACVLLFSRRFAAATIFVVAMLLTMTPWLVRSSLLGGRFVLLSTTAPVNFAMATAPGSSTVATRVTPEQARDYRDVDPCGHALATARTPHESVRADDVCVAEAFDNLRRAPGDYVRSRVAQFLRFPVTTFDFVTGNRGFVVKLLLFTLFSLAPFLLGIAGTLCGWRCIETRLAAAVWIFTILVYAIGYMEYRYFLPAVPLLLVCAAATGGIRGREVRRPGD